MDAYSEKVLELIFQGGVALAGLILVFLGYVLTSYDSYDQSGKKAVRAKYRSRTIQALMGFLAALLSAILSLIAYGEESIVLYYGSLLALVVSFVMVAWVAIMAVFQMG